MKTNSCNYKILKNTKLVLQYYRGKYDIPEAKAMKIQILEAPSYKENSDFIIDIRDTTISIDFESIKAFSSFVENYLEKNKISKTAILTSSPSQVANSVTLFSFLTKHKNYFRVFNSLSAAAQWIGLNSKEEHLAQETLLILKER
ncbi:MAG: hypothetical protein COB98_11370 [Flavobacteriaceae bacterium]|nr:MAG: hypothetical protein COB98_11370 [Flavobacteriaceae bacterium]